MSGAWIIKYHNLSSQNLTVTGAGGSAQAVVGETNHEPASTLTSGGQDYLSLDQNSFKFIANGDIDFHQGLRLNGHTLYIRLHVPIQVFGIGSAPYWYYCKDEGSGHTPSNDSSVWTKCENKTVSTVFAGLTAKMSPVSTHTTLTVSVTVDDKS